ncbi:MAG: AraC family transcriptional regulator [Cohaesibacter sp.]|nr:AraC family transcriptional regulator [Cohaesibacter sp.]
MPVLPVPAFVALLLAFFALKAFIRRDCQPLFLVLLVSMAVQNLIIALHLHYGLTALRWVQPISASFIPALAYLAFVSSSLRSLSWSRDSWHLVGPGVTIFALLAAPVFLDILLPVLFSLYGAAILIILIKGQDRLIKSRLEAGSVPLKLWRMIALALLLSALSEVIITFDYLYNEGTWSLMIIGGFSSLILMMIGLLSLSPVLQPDFESDLSEPDSPNKSGAALQSDSDAKALLERLDRLLSRQELYLDPSLSLAKLAKRLHVPAKDLSIAVNRISGENVSRYINRYRISHACIALQQGESITHAMLASGFNTKSNFNREFLRVHGQSPSDWRKQDQTSVDLA